MSDINKLVEYLNFEYKGEKNEDSTSIIVIDENFGTEESNIKEFLIVDLENNSLFKRLYLNTDFIYLNVSQEETIYYKGQIQANGPILYSNILSVDVWEELDDSNFITVTLNTQSEGFSTSFNAFPDGFYYNYEEATLYYKSLDTAFVYVKSFIFHYFYQDIADISNGTYLLNYKDNEGYTIDFGDSLLKYISETKLQTAISNNQRKITLTKATLSGMVFRFPKIRKGELKYLYKLPEGNFFPRTKFFDNDIAIHLSFATIYGQLEFLNQTIFEYVSYFSEDISGTAGVFYREYSDMVLFELKAAKFDDKLKIIYHLPVFFLVQIDSRDLNLWEVLGEMLENAVTNAGTNKEDIAIKLLRILLEKDGSDMFLENLLTQKTENITFFSLLYEKLNGDNFVKFITFMWQVWIQTKYVLPVNTIYEGFESPWMLPFSSKIQFGFYWSNISVAYTEKENAIQFAYDTGQTEMIYLPALEGKEGLNPYKSVPVKEYYTYHVYQPLLLKDVDGNNQTALELLQKETLVPAFVLKANQEKQFWSNVVTAGEYAIDIVTTFSGVGNVLKFRHLNKLRLLGEVSQTITYVKLAVGVSEITTGSLNLALKLSDLKDTPFGKELSNYLFIIELLSLGGEIAAALKGALAKSADDLLKHEDALRKSAKNADEVKKVDELIEHLEETAEIEQRLVNDWDGGKFLSERTLRKRIRHLLQEYKNFKLEVLFVEELKDIKRITDWNARNVLGSFSMGPPPKLYFRKQVTALTWQHELWHLEDLKKMGNKKFYATPNWKKEELVWVRIWNTRNKWTEEELVDSYKYYKESCNDEMIKSIPVKEMEDLLEKPYYKYSRYNK